MNIAQMGGARLPAARLACCVILAWQCRGRHGFVIHTRYPIWPGTHHAVKLYTLCWCATATRTRSCPGVARTCCTASVDALMNSRQADRASAGAMSTSCFATPPGHSEAVAMSYPTLPLTATFVPSAVALLSPPSALAAAAAVSMSGATMAMIARSTASPPA